MAPRHDASKLERFRYEYGATPLHLLATVASLAVLGYAMIRIFEIPSTAGILLWLGAAIIAHDFIALPFYSLLNRIAEEGTDAAIEPRRSALTTLNHVRIPAAISAVLLLISFPLVFQIDEPRYRLTLGSQLNLDGYLPNWLLLTAGLFVISALLYALKLRGKGRKNPRRPMIGYREPRQPPLGPPNRALVIASKAILAIGAVFAAFVAAAALYGFLTAFPF